MSVILRCLFLPLLGTTAGSACVFFMKNDIDKRFHRALLGFAAGVMTAASVWSLIIPAIEMSGHLGFFSFVPAVTGFWIGIILLWSLDRFLPEPHLDDNTQEKKTSMLIPAVVIHNIPEGMAVGAVLASFIRSENMSSGAIALTLAIGIAIQNFPEGSIISMPLAASGMSKHKSFWSGFLSGVPEPIAAWLTLMLASVITPILPYTLSFAAGAMIFVVVSELIPEMTHYDCPYLGTMMFALGFTVMMTLDVALGC